MSFVLQGLGPHFRPTMYRDVGYVAESGDVEAAIIVDGAVNIDATDGDIQVTVEVSDLEGDGSDLDVIGSGEEN